jgi:hypothetical protein
VPHARPHPRAFALSLRGLKSGRIPVKFPAITAKTLSKYYFLHNIDQIGIDC